MYCEELSVTGPEPVLLADAKLHARVEITADDTLIDEMIKAARIWAEDWTNRRYVIHQFEITFDLEEICQPLEVETISEITSVDSFQRFDTADIETSVPVADFRIQNNLLILDVTAFNAFDAREFGAYELTYTVGPPTVLRDSVREAIKLIVTHLYENRESASIDVNLREIPLGAKALLNNDRVYIV